MAPASPDVVEDSSALEWKRCWIDDRSARYGVAGEGLPVLFLHGWALGSRSYRKVVDRLVAQGCRVHVPALPGFGGSEDLPRSSFSMAGYARWVDGFCAEVGIDEPQLVIGHSFGGGVAIKLAHLFPERARSLVLVNSVGGSAWKQGRGLRSMADRPLWDWGLHFPADIWPIPQATRVIPVVLEDAVPNLVRNPRAFWRVGGLVRRVDLTHELEELKDRELPVAVLWGSRDGLVPEASFADLCRAIGSEGEVIDGSHSWLLADPDAFGEVITNHVDVAKLARDLEQRGPRRRGVLGRLADAPRNLKSFVNADDG